MSKFLKFIVHFAVICTIVCVLGLALPPFFGVRTVIMDSTDKATNLPLGSVTYAIPVRTEEVTAGSPILVQEDGKTYKYNLVSVNRENNTGTVIDTTTSAQESITVSVKNWVPKIVITIPFVGYLLVATESVEGLIVLGLVILFLIILYVIAELWRKDPDDDEYEDLQGDTRHVKSSRELKAEEKGVTPKAFVDEVSTEIKRIWDLMNTSYDKFIRTTDADHEKQVQKIFKKLYDKGDIYKGHYEGMYCTPCESFFTESQLVDGKCPDCGREVQPAKEEAYFFRMSKYADRLIEHINTHPEFIQPVSRKNEMMNNFLLPGLQDLCVSRTSFKWGIPVDFDPKHVTYVWLDALTNYITGIGYDCDGNHDEKFNKFWPADLHLIGKDIIRFHTIYWPIFLMALDLPLPKQVFGHPWLLQGDGKMSKSKGNVLYADTLVDFFGVDAVRYFVLHEMPFENDGVISWELMVERMNSDLANILGNLVNRTVSMTNKYFGGVVENKNVCEDVDDDLKAAVLEAVKKADEKMEKLRVADAITEIFNIFRRSNKYIDETTPWTLAKDEEKKDRLATVLYNLTEAITIGASLLSSFMPETSEKILAQLNTEKRTLEAMEIR